MKQARSFLIVLGTALGVVVITAVMATRQGHPGHGSHDSTKTDPSTSCGPVSLSIVSRALGRPLPIAAWHQAAGAGELGACSIADLLRALRGNGFAATPISVKGGSLPRLSGPMIVHLDDHHFAIILHADTDRPVLVDPPHPVRVVSRAGLGDRWKGVAVVVALDPSARAGLTEPEP